MATNVLNDNSVDSEQVSRKKLVQRMEKQISLMFNLPTKPVEQEQYASLKLISIESKQ